mmetsp:Transcript_62330/g.75017  ORF Transcript_62330/g.75017 Transcript_62330/m.75017 type:complete len:358 (+) Transcript_62330:36-1109(+)
MKAAHMTNSFSERAKSEESPQDVSMVEDTLQKMTETKDCRDDRETTEAPRSRHIRKTSTAEKRDVSSSPLKKEEISKNKNYQHQKDETSRRRTHHRRGSEHSGAERRRCNGEEFRKDTHRRQMDDMYRDEYGRCKPRERYMQDHYLNDRRYIQRYDGNRGPRGNFTDNRGPHSGPRGTFERNCDRYNGPPRVFSGHGADGNRDHPYDRYNRDLNNEFRDRARFQERCDDRQRYQYSDERERFRNAPPLHGQHRRHSHPANEEPRVFRGGNNERFRDREMQSQVAMRENKQSRVCRGREAKSLARKFDGANCRNEQRKSKSNRDGRVQHKSTRTEEAAVDNANGKESNAVQTCSEDSQ